LVHVGITRAPRRSTLAYANELLSLDSTTISLCLTMFPWAKFRRAKGGVKAHVLLDHDDYLPAYAANRADLAPEWCCSPKPNGAI
jgi:hypothetical protein